MLVFTNNLLFLNKNAHIPESPYTSWYRIWFWFIYIKERICWSRQGNWWNCCIKTY